MRQTIYERQHDVQVIRSALLANSPAVRVERSLSRLDVLLPRLAVTARDTLGTRRHRLELAMRELHAVSPLATLDRGYAIIMDSESGSVLTSAADASEGQSIRAKLSSGSVIATVDEVQDD